MKKLLTIIALSGILFFSASTVFAQAQRQLNIGLIGVSYEIPVATDITIAPAAGVDINFNHLSIGVKANYYFDGLFGLPDEWDVFGGINAGYGIALDSNNNSDFDFGLQIGGRWFWNDKWGVYVELGGGILNGAGGGVGVTMKM
jgi:hypothetical protein